MGRMRRLLPVLVALALGCGLPPAAHAGPEEHQRVLAYVTAEERAARDLMSSFDEVYDVPQLTRIALEDAAHVRALQRLGIPAVERPRGDFGDYPGLQQDYWRWLAEGYVDLRSAAQAGVAIERQHLAVLDAAIAVEIDARAWRTLRKVRRDDARHLTMLWRLWQATPPAQPCGVPAC